MPTTLATARLYYWVQALPRDTGTYPFLTTTTNFGDDFNFPETEGERLRALGVGCGYPSS